MIPVKVSTCVPITCRRAFVGGPVPAGQTLNRQHIVSSAVLVQKGKACHRGQLRHLALVIAFAVVVVAATVAV